MKSKDEEISEIEDLRKQVDEDYLNTDKPPSGAQPNESSKNSLVAPTVGVGAGVGATMGAGTGTQITAGEIIESVLQQIPGFFGEVWKGFWNLGN